MPLNQKQIDAAKPGAKPKRLHDAGGLYLEIAPSGGRWWRFAYRFGSKRKLLSLGTLPTVTLAKARSRRNALRDLLADGVDPGAKRKADKHEALGREINSFEAVAREWYAKQAHTWVPTHATDVLRRLESNLFPEIGGEPIAEITAPMLLAAVRKIEQRGAYDLAHRVLQVAGQVFRYGVATGRCERDPAPDLRGALTPHKKKNQAAVTAEELPELLRAIDGYGALGDKLTGLRAAVAGVDVRSHRRIDRRGVGGNRPGRGGVDHSGGTHEDENRARRPAFAASSRRYCARCAPSVAAAATSFPVAIPDKPISNNTMLFALYRLGYKGKMTGHGFRAVASTILNEAGFRPDVIERQLAHCERNEIRGAYNRAEYLPERREMMQQWADMLDALAQGAQVIPLQRRA